jgi:hypothetical protein
MSLLYLPSLFKNRSSALYVPSHQIELALEVFPHVLVHPTRALYVRRIFQRLQTFLLVPFRRRQHRHRMMRLKLYRLLVGKKLPSIIIIRMVYKRRYQMEWRKRQM